MHRLVLATILSAASILAGSQIASAKGKLNPANVVDGGPVALPAGQGEPVVIIHDDGPAKKRDRLDEVRSDRKTLLKHFYEDDRDDVDDGAKVPLDDDLLQ